MAHSADHKAATPLAAQQARSLVRDLAGADAMLLRGRASRRRDLQALLEFSGRRRLARLAGGPQRPADQPAAPEPAATARREPAGRAAAAPRLLERVDVSADLLRLKLSRPPGFRYQPGQHVKMGVPGLLRTYSLVSAPHEPQLEFFVELFPGGRLSERLRSLRPGSAMALSDRAKGRLQIDQRVPNHLLIATVTGIAPYLSLLRHHLQHGRAAGRRFVILHGASHADEFGYAGELRELARRHPDAISYVPTVSQPASPRNARWTGRRGRVETHVDALLTRLGLSAGDTAVYACGHPGMVANVAAGFRRRGFAIQTEAFD